MTRPSRPRSGPQLRRPGSSRPEDAPSTQIPPPTGPRRPLLREGVPQAARLVIDISGILCSPGLRPRGIRQIAGDKGPWRLVGPAVRAPAGRSRPTGSASTQPQHRSAAGVLQLTTCIEVLEQGRVGAASDRPDYGACLGARPVPRQCGQGRSFQLGSGSPWLIRLTDHGAQFGPLCWQRVGQCVTGVGSAGGVAVRR